MAVLISKMPRMRPDLEADKLGECYKNKPDFIKVSWTCIIYCLRTSFPILN